MYTLELVLWLVHPGPFQLITVTLSVLITYYVDNCYGLHDIQDMFHVYLNRFEFHFLRSH